MSFATKIDVLDHGYVELWGEPLGDEMRVVQAARTSYLGETKGYNEDIRLLKYLWKHKHMSPFEFVQFHFRVKAPIFVMRQWMRYRTWSYNEQSRRYTSDNIEFYTPDSWRGQDNVNKQASNGLPLNTNESLTYHYKTGIDSAYAAYQVLLSQGVAREIARGVLPVSVYTTVVASVNLRNLIHFLEERMTHHAQWEIRQYAKAVFKLVQPYAPVTFELFAQENPECFL